MSNKIPKFSVGEIVIFQRSWCKATGRIYDIKDCRDHGRPTKRLYLTILKTNTNQLAVGENINEYYELDTPQFFKLPFCMTVSEEL